MSSFYERLKLSIKLRYPNSSGLLRFATCPISMGRVPATFRLVEEQYADVFPKGNKPKHQ
jgi:hypothetical protein